ncbi:MULTISPECIES: ABC transporter substrate-binding protein [Bifidobacterium]|uniref:ABC transporter substrate-binding protein n=1 Tax=Bifidobacterium TaxID=1678 RepID=UPI001BDC0886|nr:MULTISPECIES: extracellular solute-binding protein [Bifidobacterium]MBT1161904.1 extracellular solute-binding protein [Bifidobacterium sp. SO1]MBW3079389.1 extracellular solute-binding protein [Bifidobacterium simiiventris]
MNHKETPNSIVPVIPATGNPASAHGLRRRTRAIKVAVASAAVLAMLVPMAACGSTSAGSNGGKTTLTLFSWDNDKTMEPYIAAFEKAYPDITVDQSSAPNNADKDSTLAARISGNQAPDVFYMGGAKTTRTVRNGYALDVTNEPFVKKMSDANRDWMSKDGKVYGVSMTSWESGIVYNKDLLAKVGATGIPETWDEFLDLCKKLKAAGITPFLEHLDETPHLLAACLGGQYAKKGNSIGDEIITVEGKSTFAKEYTDCLTQWNRLYSENIEDRSAVGVSSDEVVQQFVGGQLAMYITGPWDIKTLNDSGVNWDMDLVPTFNDAEARYGAGAASNGYAIYSKLTGKKLDAAKKWLEFMVSDDALKIQAAAGNAVTVQGFKQDVDEHYKKVYENGLVKSRYYLPIMHWNTYSSGLSPEVVAQIQLLVQGRQNPQQTAENLDKKLATLK